MPEPRATKKAPPRTSRSRSKPAPETSLLDAVADEAAAKVGEYVKDVSAISAASVAKIRSGSYKVEDVWSDGIALWGANMKAMASAFSVGTSAAKALAPDAADKG